jgi:hypothetical protein
MKKGILTIVCALALLFTAHAQKDPCNPGDTIPPCPQQGCLRPDCKCPPEPPPGPRMPVVAPMDPNEIIGPKGFDSLKWVSAKATLPYKILFENDPDFATAPAQKVIIYCPLHPNINPSSLRLGDFGFGSFNFSVPANSSTFSRRLDVKDSLGVFVDVTAGLDIANRRAFWIFESIDPATGLAGTVNASKGFLPINDSLTHKGEGYVTFTVIANRNTATRDSINKQASIIFDVNEPIATNITLNLIDAVAPVSAVQPLPSLVDNVFTISWAAQDDSLGSGVKEYALYYSKNNGPFVLHQKNIDSTHLTFTGDKGATYAFYTIATDNTGNEEVPKTAGEQLVTVKGEGLLVSARAFLQGGYTPATGLMVDSLRTLQLLPQSDPYRSLGFTAINNTLVETTKAGVLDSIEIKGITDWVWIELRNSSNPAQVVANRAALIRRDGSIVDMDGYSPVFFNKITEGNYYIAVRHRNHFGVMTATALTLTKTSTATIDFTNPATATWGTDAQRNQNGVMLMWAGDINRDRFIKYNGSANDKVLILAKVGLANPNNILTLYDINDLNLDGKVKYNGSANDKTIILNNVGIATPNNILTEQIP